MNHRYDEIYRTFWAQSYKAVLTFWAQSYRAVLTIFRSIFVHTKFLKVGNRNEGSQNSSKFFSIAKKRFFLQPNPQIVLVHLLI